jgi:hypothetical protein
MPSPFPGMNPYLEQPPFWLDFHNSFLIYLRGALEQRVPANYFVQYEERLYLSEWPIEETTFLGRADVSLSRPPSDEWGRTGTTATVESPCEVVVDVSETTSVGALEIKDSAANEVVTVIELLSPSNKYAGYDRAAYLEKRNELMRTTANLVELDFLRGGPKLPARGLPPCDYHVLTSRPSSRPKADVWPFALRDPFPSLTVPLREVNTVSVSLKDVLDQAYDAARYEKRIYKTPPKPALLPADAAWAADLLRAAGVIT